VDATLAENVGNYLGLTPKAGQPNANAGRAKKLSQLEYVPGTPATRKVAILAADGVNGAEVTQMQGALQEAGVMVEVVAPHLGAIQSANGDAVPVNQSLLTTASVLYDAVYVPGGADSVNALQGSGDALHFIQEAFKHYKPVAASGEGADFFQAAGIAAEPGVVTGENGTITSAFLEAIGQHRFWDRQLPARMPA
jgi:catalase